MAFCLDRTVAYLKICEPDLISIHRSTHPIVPSDNCSLGHLCDAFICLTRENGSNRVWVALYDIHHKSNLVFVADSEAADSRERSHLVLEAVSFLTSLGFTMEPVNLGFSPAMREVIMRDLKIMRPPKAGAVKRHTQSPAVVRQAAIEIQLPEAITAEEQLPQAKGEDADREADLKARLADATSTLERLQAEKEELANRGKRDLKALKAELARSRREFDTAETARREAEKALSTSAAASGVSVAALEVERDDLLRELADAREEAGALRSELLEMQAVHISENQALRQEVECLRGERAVTMVAVSGELEIERDALLRELADVREEVGSLRSELLEMQAAHITENQALRQEIECLRGESAVAAVAASGEQESLHAALAVSEEALCNERSKYESAHRELETLHAALGISDEALSIERSKNESALREMDALERNAAAEIKSLQMRIDALSSEKRLLVTKAEEMKGKAKGEIERLRQENQTQRRAAVKKLNSLKEELSQLAETRAIMTSPFGLPPLQGDTPDRPATGNVAEAEMPAAGPPGTGNTHTDPFRSTGCSDDMCFEPDPDMKGIPYATPEDLIEVQRSFNKIQAAPSGNLVQSCEGFVCLVKHDGKKMVYVAWLMNETGELLVCRPERAPENVKAARLAFREGIGYFERVGFLMDRLELETDPERRQRQLDKLPIFDRIVTECAA